MERFGRRQQQICILPVWASIWFGLSQEKVQMDYPDDVDVREQLFHNAVREYIVSIKCTFLCECNFVSNIKLNIFHQDRSRLYDLNFICVLLKLFHRFEFNHTKCGVGIFSQNQSGQRTVNWSSIKQFLGLGTHHPKDQLPCWRSVMQKEKAASWCALRNFPKRKYISVCN